jgi:hypothetical protein
MQKAWWFVYYQTAVPVLSLPVVPYTGTFVTSKKGAHEMKQKQATKALDIFFV